MVFERTEPIPSTMFSWFAGPMRLGLAGILLGPGVVAASQQGAQGLHPAARGWIATGPSSSPLPVRREVIWNDGDRHGVGPGYKVKFDDRGFDFSVADASPGQVGGGTIRGVTESIGRLSPTGFKLSPVEARELASDDHGVSYQHPSVVERYDILPEGVELSYVFEELPSGTGDLIVRVGIATSLAASAEDARSSTLTFDSGEQPVISIGEVFGVDADGRRARGSMTFANGVLELALPAAFVETAVLPLVLDPLIGQFAYSGGEESIAYDPVSDLFAVLSSQGIQNNATLSVQLTSPAGAMVGQPILIGGSLWQGSLVASVAARGRVLIYYRNGNGAYLRTLDPRSRSLSAAVVVPGAIPNSGEIHLGGDMSSRAQAMLMQVSGTKLSVAAVDVDAAGDVTIMPPVLVTSSLPLWNSGAEMSNTGGANGRHMVVWSESGPSGNQGDVRGAIIGRDGMVLEARQIASSPRNEYLPHVDGNGTKWLVSYEVDYFDMEGAMVFWDTNSATSYLGSTVSLAAPSTGFAAPGPVVFAGGSYLLSYDNSLVYPYGADYFLMVDAIDGRRLAPPLSVQPWGHLRGASQHWRRSGPSDIVMLVNGIRGYRYQVDDGITADLGGGCGRGGHIGVSGARSKAMTATLHLRDALPAVPAVLIVGSTTVNLPCGPCTLVPDPATGITLPLGVTDNHGNASVQVPVTNLYGVTFIEQWAILGGNACALGLELSNAVQVQIQ